MSSGRHKQSAAEVSTARTRFDATLQQLVEKKDEGPMSSDEGGEIEISLNDPSPIHSPSKRNLSGKRKRKRGREDTEYEQGLFHHTYIMKLFDRSVDLAVFDEDAPLYPICRAWLRNQPHQRNIDPARSPTPEPENPAPSEDEPDRIQDVYKMPPPIKQDPDDLTDYRIPHPVPQPKTYFFISDGDDAPPAENLLLKHMERWKQVRQSWVDQGRINEMRYAESMQVLRDIFDYQMKDM